MRRSATITDNFALSLGNCAAGRDLGRMLPREMFVAGIYRAACPSFCKQNVTSGEHLSLRCCFVCLLSLPPVLLVLPPAWLLCAEMLLLLLRGDDG